MADWIDRGSAFFFFVPIHTPIAERRNPDAEVHPNVYAVHDTYVGNAATLREGHQAEFRLESLSCSSNLRLGNHTHGIVSLRT